jgi:hypothetical protein
VDDDVLLAADDGVVMPSSRSEVMNTVRVTTHGREIGESTDVEVYRQTNPIRINAGETQFLMGPYEDPVSGERIGATDVQVLVAGSDYLFNVDQDGGSSDLTDDLAGTVRPSGSGYDIGAYEHVLLEQVARPSGDVTTGAWIPVPSGSLYAKLDETTPDDNDYIYTRTAASACEMTLSPVAAPGGSATYEFSYRGRGAYTVHLKQGASTTVASWTENDAVYTTHTRTLTSGQAALITDPSTLRVRIVSG